MARENEFEPRLGRARSLGKTKGRKYLHLVLAAVNLAGVRGGARRSSFQGNRIGRGSGVGRVLASRDRFAAYRQRRVIIKSRIVRLAGKGLAGARAHLRYIQRDGVTREGERGALYGPGDKPADGQAFHERSTGDRHQFRFIVSPEDGGDYESLRPLTRRLMAQMEQDLGTRLDWVAVDHFNTGHPHVHVMLRGVDEMGKDLVIARDYLSVGMRERAAELVGLDLGPRTDLEIERRLAAEVEQDRLTSLDRRLLAVADQDRRVSPDSRDPARQTLLTGRLRKLEKLGLADQIAPGRWQLAETTERTLRDLGERGDIIKTLHRELAGQVRGGADFAVFDPGDAAQRPVIGRMLSRGLSDELNDRHFLIVDGVDGRTHYVEIGRGEALAPVPRDAIVRIEARQATIRAADRLIAEVAAANGGTYSADLHLRHDPQASQAFAETHVRRLEAMRRAGVDLVRHADGRWSIGEDHLRRAAAFEREQARGNPVSVEILSRQPLHHLPEAEGPTWLDRELLRDTPEPLRDAGFGKEVRGAQMMRRRWLLDQALVRETGGPVAYPKDLIETLRRRELAHLAGQLEKETGLGYRRAGRGERISGTFRRAIDGVGGRYALIERTKDFTLVPWRPVLQGREGQTISGLMRGEGISFTIGRGRTGPSIS